MNTEVEASVSHRIELISLYLSTFFLRTGFGAAILLFDWLLVWALELGKYSTSSAYSLFLISFAAITYYIAEIFLTGYYGSKSDMQGVKSILLYATIGAMVVLLFYAPASLIFIRINNVKIAIFILASYLAIIHFLHGVFASAKVAPTLGFINQLSSNENRALHMAWYDNAILYGRAAGIFVGGGLWILLKVDNKSTSREQANQIAKTFPILSGLLLIATLLIIFGLPNIKKTEGHSMHSFSIRRDVSIAARVMLSEKRKPMLLPWISIAALIGSASLWGPTVSFILSDNQENDRGFNALLPILIILVGLALPAPFWGIFADKKGRKITLLIGLIGLPIMGILGLAVGYPFYKNDLSIHNPMFLLSILPGAFMFSSLIPVLMGILGDTADVDQDGETMSGYHFVIATGEIIGVLGGGLFIGFFALFQSFIPVFGNGQDGTNIAILVGFVLFELILVAGMFFGILRLPEEDRYDTRRKATV